MRDGPRSLEQQLAERELLIRELKAGLAGAEAARAGAEAELDALYGSRVVRYSRPFRFVFARLLRLRRAPALVLGRIWPRLRMKLAAGGTIRYDIDTPRRGDVVESDLFLDVAGWVICETEPIARVEVFVNGVSCGRARLGLSRPEVGRRLGRRRSEAQVRVEAMVNGIPHGGLRLGFVLPRLIRHLGRRLPEAHICGFETLVDLRGVPLGGEEGRVQVVVETFTGARHPLEPVLVKVAGADGEQGRDGILAPSSTRSVAPLGEGTGLSLAPAPAASAVAGLSVAGRRFAVTEGDGTPPLRLLVFTHDLGLGGGQLYLHELLRLLARRPMFSATVVSPVDGPIRERTEALGIPVVVTGYHPMRRHRSYEERQEELGTLAREGQFNAVLANTLSCFPGVDLATRLGLPAVWAIHDSLELPAFWRAAFGYVSAVDPVVRVRAEIALTSAAAVVFEADATRNLLVRYGDPRRYVTLPYGIDLEQIDGFAETVSLAEARRRLDLPEEGAVLLCLGTIEPRKAQAALAQAFSAAASDHPEALLVFVGGRRDDFTDGLYQYVQTAGLESRVRVVAVTSDIYLWYRAADALVIASDVESLPRTVLEAMAFSLPVIATRVFGLPELIEDGVTGYLCEPRDIRALADVLDRFLRTSPQQRAWMGAAGARLIRAQHDSRGYAGAYDRLLRALVEDPTLLPGEILGAEVRQAS